jgi:hypothetical protein
MEENGKYRVHRIEGLVSNQKNPLDRIFSLVTIHPQSSLLVQKYRVNQFLDPPKPGGSL